MSEFQREHRYYVAKVSDARKYLTDLEQGILAGLLGKITGGRLQDDKAPLICCVVEQDWPEYEPTWQAIEERVTGGTAGGGRDMEVERLRGLILRATAELEVVEYDNDPPARVVALLDDMRAVSRAALLRHNAKAVEPARSDGPA